MKTIYVVGGSGFARECHSHIQELISHGEKILFGGFLGHGGYGHTVDYKRAQSLYRGELTDHAIGDVNFFVIGAGYPHLRKKIYDDLKCLDVNFYTLIAHGVKLPKSIEYGEANIFTSPFCPSIDVTIGCGNLFLGCFGLGHDSHVGDFNFFAPSSQALGNVKVGHCNAIGANALLLPNVKIGNGNKISPLSTIYKGCKSNGYYHGNPAIRVGDVEEQ